MNDDQLNDVASRAKRLYDVKLRATLEDGHRDQFVAIEPLSGDYYLGRTLSEAMAAARAAHPDHLAHTIRIGHDAALHFGVSVP